MADAPDAGMDAVQRRLMFEDECILVDENDRVVGHELKYNCHLWEKIVSENLLHRAFSVFLFNSKHELLLQQRSATKVTFPLVWTNTCCSHPLYRESELIDEDALGVRNAAQRKLLDELECSTSHLLMVNGESMKWTTLLFIDRDVSIHPNPDEVADVKYVNKEQLKELLKKADLGEEAMFLAYGSVRWWGVFTAEQYSGINLFVATFAVPFMGFKLIAVPGSTREIVSIKVDSDVVEP
ncbi:hypothetical protein SAY86_028792 [Trapa natans]|uniref:isopentenyl-diphosphate Delta-isomerase n=1 Tax=Trapa natans TaxID=22666 RepID=A0AAN7M044_TRANT|nr:hypothetical protein SAY86_028792 [Trapa natans]